MLLGTSPQDQGEAWRLCRCRRAAAPEVAAHVEALVVAVQHVHRAALQPRLPVQLPQQQDRAWRTTGRPLQHRTARFCGWATPPRCGSVDDRNRSRRTLRTTPGQPISTRRRRSAAAAADARRVNPPARKTRRPGCKAGPRTYLVVAAVQHIAELHHHRVAANPHWPLRLILRQHARDAQRSDDLADVAVHVTDCAHARRQPRRAPKARAAWAEPCSVRWCSAHAPLCAGPALPAPQQVQQEATSMDGLGPVVPNSRGRAPLTGHNLARRLQERWRDGLGRRCRGLLPAHRLPATTVRQALGPGSQAASRSLPAAPCAAAARAPVSPQALQALLAQAAATRKPGRSAPAARHAPVPGGHMADGCPTRFPSAGRGQMAQRAFHAARLRASLPRQPLATAAPCKSSTRGSGGEFCCTVLANICQCGVSKGRAAGSGRTISSS